MREQLGRSLIEIIGVLALGGIMTVATYNVYMSISQRNKNMIASETLKDIATKTKTLLEYSNYKPVSVDFLIEAGVLKNSKAPIGNANWTITPSYDYTEFSINLFGLNYAECSYFSTKTFNWVKSISVNGSAITSSKDAICLQTGDNAVSFLVK